MQHQRQAAHRLAQLAHQVQVDVAGHAVRRADGDRERVDPRLLHEAAGRRRVGEAQLRGDDAGLASADVAQLRLQRQPGARGDRVRLVRLAQIALQRARGAVEHERGEAGCRSLAQAGRVRDVIHVHGDRHARALRQRPGERDRGGDPAEMVEVGGVELEQHGRVARLGGIDHAQRHLRVGDVEAGHGVAAALRPGEQLTTAYERHGYPMTSFSTRPRVSRPAAAGERVAIRVRARVTLGRRWG